MDKLGKTQRFLLKVICNNIALSYHERGRYQFWWSINSYIYRHAPLPLTVKYTEFGTPTPEGQIGEQNIYWEKLLVARVAVYSTYLRNGYHIPQNSHFHLLEYTLF